MSEANERIFELTLRTYFLDTTALVKLVCDEPGSAFVRALSNDPSCSFYTSWILLAEALGVLKRKWRKRQLSDTDNEQAVQELLLHVRIGSIVPVDLEIVNGEAHLKTYELEFGNIRRRYPELDAADAIQFRAIEEGILKCLAGVSKPRLVSADGGLLDAATNEKIETIRIPDGEETSNSVRS